MSPQDVELYSEIITERDHIAFEKGIEEGLREGEVRLVLRMLMKKFGAVDETLRQRIEALTTAQVGDLADTLLSFQTVDELRNWLDANTSNTA